MEKTPHEKRENVRAIEAIRVFKNDVVVVRKRQLDLPEDRDTRGEITKWTSRAQKRLGFIAANTEVEFLTMITLTYPREWVTDGQEVKRHLNLFLKRLARRHDHSYLWFLEFQMRGAPHYHVLTTIAEVVIDKLWVSSAWWEIVASQNRDHLLAGTRVEKLRKTGAWYAVKYAYKMRQKEVPKNYRNVGRFYGYSRDVKPQPYMELSGNIDDIFEGCDGYVDLLESGYAVLFGLAGNVGENAVKGIINETHETI
jgi:hypothetical protein